MTTEQIITIITNILTSGGVVIFFWFLVRSLRLEIKALNATIEAQKKTLEVMEQRVSETGKIGDIYKNFIEQIPKHIDQYQDIISKTKDKAIEELEKANQLKDEKLKNNAEIELKKVEIQERALTDLPRLSESLLKILNAMTERFETVNKLEKNNPFDMYLNPSHLLEGTVYKITSGSNINIISSANNEGTDDVIDTDYVDVDEMIDAEYVDVDENKL